MIVYAATNIRSAKSFPYETEIPPACHVSYMIAASDTNHFLILKYTLSKILTVNYIKFFLPFCQIRMFFLKEEKYLISRKFFSSSQICSLNILILCMLYQLHGLSAFQNSLGD